MLCLLTVTQWKRRKKQPQVLHMTQIFFPLTGSNEKVMPCRIMFHFFFKFACWLLCLERNEQFLILMAVSVQWGETEYQPNVICLSLSDINILLSIDGLCTVTQLPVN